MRGNKGDDETPPPSCDLCGIDEVKLVRFSLVRNIAVDGGRRSSRGFGGILMCEKCWRRVRARTRRRTTPKVAA